MRTHKTRQVLQIMTAAKKDQIRALLKSIETGDPGPVSIVNEAKYIQHNPQTHEGSEGLAALFQRLSGTSPRVNIVRAFEDGDFVFAHTEYDFARRNIGFEVFFSARAILSFASARATTGASTPPSMIYFDSQEAKWWNTGTPPKK